MGPLCHGWVVVTLQVQPDLEELEVNMEDNEDAESTKSEVKLGKLQFSMDYDFQKSEVSDLKYSMVPLSCSIFSKSLQ